MPKASVSDITELSDQAIDWIVRLNSAQATEQDRLLAAQWRHRSPSHRKAYAEAEQLMLDMGEAMAAKPLRAEAPAFPVKPARYAAPALRISAAVCLLLLLALPFTSLNDRWFSDYYTAVGEQKTVILADGSRVTLDTDTALTVAYSATGRQLTLKRGQALFLVAADRARPFEVVAGPAVVKALGTVFEVAEVELATRITVLEHAVGVKGLHERDYPATARIEAGLQALYDRENGLRAGIAVDTNSSTAWQRGKLVFNNQTLKQVVAELDRYVPGRIALIDGHTANLRVSGVFPVNDPAATLKMIEQILPVKVTRITPWLTLLHG